MPKIKQSPKKENNLLLSQRYQALLTHLEVEFKDLSLLDLAFVHKSYINENRGRKTEHNERLEFLGDAVLELVVTEYLYQKYPLEEEGVLTNWRSALVQGKRLSEIAHKMDLGIFLYLSKGEERSGGRQKGYILANTLEALIGAIYLDRGYKQVDLFISRHILSHLDRILEAGEHIDAKSLFQEKAQEILMITPEYHLLSEAGPDHEKIFTMGLFLGKQKIAEGQGSSKQKAEQEAAKNGLKVQKWA